MKSKEGTSGLPPRQAALAMVLESKLDAKVQLSHRSIRGEATDYSSPAAVYAVVGVTQVYLVEDVEGLEPELPFHLLGNSEVLKQGQI